MELAEKALRPLGAAYDGDCQSRARHQQSTPVMSSSRVNSVHLEHLQYVLRWAQS